MAEPTTRELPDVLVAPRELFETLIDTLIELGAPAALVASVRDVVNRDRREHVWQGRHLAHRPPLHSDEPGWVVTLVSEEPAEGHLENLMETIAMLAAVKGERGVPLARERETQRALMRRGIAVTVE